jgi:hypothetical protein
VNIGSAESKKGLLFFITALCFSFQVVSVKNLVKASGTGQLKKENYFSLNNSKDL